MKGALKNGVYTSILYTAVINHYPGEIIVYNVNPIRYRTITKTEVVIIDIY